MPGYIVGALCAVCGLIFLALPVPVIVQNFTTFYTHAKARQRLREHTNRQKDLSKQARAYHFHPAIELTKVKVVHPGIASRLVVSYFTLFVCVCGIEQSVTGINESSAGDEEKNEEEESSAEMPQLPCE